MLLIYWISLATLHFTLLKIKIKKPPPLKKIMIQPEEKITIHRPNLQPHRGTAQAGKPPPPDRAATPQRFRVAVWPPQATGGWPRGYPRTIGRLCGHPWGPRVAFGPTLDQSRAGPMATPGVAAQPLPATRGWQRGYPWSMGRSRCYHRGLGWPLGQP
jgi:hypothetical protein